MSTIKPNAPRNEVGQPAPAAKPLAKPAAAKAPAAPPAAAGDANEMSTDQLSRDYHSRMAPALRGHIGNGSLGHLPDPGEDV